MDYKKYYSEYLENVCCTIEQFLSTEEVDELRRGMDDLVNNIPEEKCSSFSVYPDVQKSNEAAEEFLNSGDKIRYFFEKEALDAEGNLLMDKKDALWKIECALHWWNPVFKKHSFSPKIKNLLKCFKYKDPVIVRSILVFKKPKIGQVVQPHRDSTFCYTEPPTCIGLWFPLLTDVTTENGCIWIVPGSHKDKIHRRSPSRNPMFLMEGMMPEYSDNQYLPVPAKLGSCVVIHGSVVHKSGINLSDESRPSYTLHLVEKGAPWSEKNWIQPSETLPFPSVYDN